MADRDLMQYSKEELASGVERLRKTARRYRDKAKETAEEFMGLALEAGGAFGVGYWIGTIKKAPDFSEEDLQIWGIDIDLAVGLGLVLVGLSGMGGKQASTFAKQIGRGVLAYWAGSQGEAIGEESE